MNVNPNIKVDSENQAAYAKKLAEKLNLEVSPEALEKARAAIEAQSRNRIQEKVDPKILTTPSSATTAAINEIKNQVLGS